MNANPTDEWKLLEDLKMSADKTFPHIVQAKNIKHIISGDLDTRLVTNPEFDGKEKLFLRAQISRIAHGTTVCPTGI